MKTTRVNDEWYPLAVKIALDNGWMVIWEDNIQIYLGRGHRRKVWYRQDNHFVDLANGVEFLEKPRKK